MPEGRPAPFKFFPKPGVDLSITFGQPVNNDHIKAALRTSMNAGIGYGCQEPINAPIPIPVIDGKSFAVPVYSTSSEVRSERISEQRWMGDVISPMVHQLEQQSVAGAEISAHGSSVTQVGLATETERIRSAVTAILQRDVEALGRKVLEINPGLCPESHSRRVNV